MMEIIAYVFSLLFFVSVIAFGMYIRMNQKENRMKEKQFTSLQKQLEYIISQKKEEKERLDILTNRDQQQYVQTSPQVQHQQHVQTRPQVQHQQIQQHDLSTSNNSSDEIHEVKITDGYDFETTIDLSSGQDDYNLNIKL
ncbi:hypothetical protein CSV79_01400 [Sporosarcina sp. P13]|uniref:hypothetical protein n=1 Tax=Sporosarcina sp. P13 TaxID=2048263 RepID=UPI000C171444|nr:hypothetical protein [Sporosarcina sp. P13]PIC65305.1 hypothetical protein CSV79_01400 [Sporosarcina sp. P13]